MTEITLQWPTLLLVRPRAPAPTWTCSHASAPSRFLPSWESEPRSPQALLWHKAWACLLPKPKVNLPKPLVLFPTGQAWLQAGGIGSSRDIRTLGPAAGIPGDSQSLAPQNSWLRHEHLGAETDLPQHGDWKLPHESLPALVKCGLAFAAPSAGWAWQQAATGTGRAGRVAGEGGDRGSTESHSRNTLMTGPALAKPCCHSIVLSCTSILETWPKNPPAAGQSPPGPQAESGSSVALLQ